MDHPGKPNTVKHAPITGGPTYWDSILAAHWLTEHAPFRSYSSRWVAGKQGGGGGGGEFIGRRRRRQWGWCRGRRWWRRWWWGGEFIEVDISDVGGCAGLVLLLPGLVPGVETLVGPLALAPLEAADQHPLYLLLALPQAVLEKTHGGHSHQRHSRAGTDRRGQRQPLRGQLHPKTSAAKSCWRCEGPEAAAGRCAHLDKRRLLD